MRKRELLDSGIAGEKKVWAETAYAYDENGNCIRIRTPEGYVLHRFFDDRDRLAHQVLDHHPINEKRRAEGKLAYIKELKNVERGRISEYAEEYGVKYVAGAKPWFEKADIALPSATQNEINEEAAKALIANGVFAVSEGANMPSTPEAIKVFQDAKILYSPGKAANAGGVAVSGLEMSQNSERLRWSREEVDAKLHDIMNDIHDNCVKYGTEADGYINYVKGANVAGFLKVAKAMMAQGIV